MSYKLIQDIGGRHIDGSPETNPLTYCLHQGTSYRSFHGSSSNTLGPDSKNCVMFMSERCANNWDPICEIESSNKTTIVPNISINGDVPSVMKKASLSRGDKLIYETAYRKYLLYMLNAKLAVEPFDPNVPDSPNVSHWIANHGDPIPVMAVDYKTIDSDPVMNKILDNPSIAIDILSIIFNSMNNHGTLKNLKGTRLNRYYELNGYYEKFNVPRI